MARNVTDRDLGLKAFIRQLQVAKTVEVAVGVHSDAMNDGKSIALYAACNEFGTNKGIPSRPFMRTAFDENISKIKEDMDNQAGEVMSGRATVRQALERIGMNHQNRVKNTISDRNFLPKNAPSTIARKKSQHTLIDSGNMLNQIHYRIRSKS